MATVNRRHFRRCVLFQSTKASVVVCHLRYHATKPQASRSGCVTDRVCLLFRNVSYSFSQPKRKLQGSGCAADRASRSNDETGREAPDQACLILVIPVLFHKPLKLTLYRPSQTGGNTKDRQTNQHRREVFFAQLSFSKESAFPSPAYFALLPSLFSFP